MWISTIHNPITLILITPMGIPTITTTDIPILEEVIMAGGVIDAGGIMGIEVGIIMVGTMVGIMEATATGDK